VIALRIYLFVDRIHQVVRIGISFVCFSELATLKFYLFKVNIGSRLIRVEQDKSGAINANEYASQNIVPRSRGSNLMDVLANLRFGRRRYNVILYRVARTIGRMLHWCAFACENVCVANRNVFATPCSWHERQIYNKTGLLVMYHVTLFIYK